METRSPLRKESLLQTPKNIQLRLGRAINQTEVANEDNNYEFNEMGFIIRGINPSKAHSPSPNAK